MRKGILLMALLVACGNPVAATASMATSTTTTTTTATTTAVVTTTAAARPDARIWRQQKLNPIGIAWNEWYNTFEAHMVELDFVNAQVDCTLALINIDEWVEALALPTPSVEVDALVPELIDAWRESFEVCEDAVTIEDWQERTRLSERATTIFNRIVELTDS